MVLDSNIVIDYLNKELRALKTLEQWREDGVALFISTITVSEVLSLPVISSEEINKLKLFLKTFTIIPLDIKIAEISAVLRRVYKLKLPDAAIVATAMFLKQPLATRDQGMKKVKEIKILY